MQPATPPVPEPGLPPVMPAAVPPVQPQAPMQAPVPNPTPQQSAAGTASNGTPEIADDGDLIEKDWVAKVKQVVQATASDPYEQNKQFTLLKADYMQKRYGKTIKSED